VAPAVTLFIDRDAWSRKLDELLRGAGIPFVAHREVFAQDARDEDWIVEVGRRGWVIVTRDQNIRRRPNERAAVERAAVHLFALTSGNLSANETAALIIQAWPAIQRAVQSTPAPALWSVTRGGDVRPIRR
jgi:predicted nuclease of predicted toxin-antitoxin system